MLEQNQGRLRFLRRSTDPRRNRLRRGVYLLPSLLTMGNMFCGYACVVYAMRGEYATAAPFIGFAVVLDMLDGRIARLTNTTSEFGVEFDSMADIISFGIAPAILSFLVGAAGARPSRLGRRLHVRRGRGDAARALQYPERRRRRQAVLRRDAESRRGRDSRRDRVRLSGWSDRLPRRAAGAGDGARAGGVDGEHDPVPQLQDARLEKRGGPTPS